ncbi:LLM class flavin-dependent oxidoreductase [Nocardioides sp. B-3]|uniref:LLM class flavin-dependent oxidoreductase n=1 Tax=Nocardioides sp. B-3 TaxID=2895565 RepID=UPI0021520CE4|nr:LLM class flavin-dependent oxidoreductase [Nocardioides sp. B-3]UUZ59080.1 LLM class flavin-dependent oxidoreductase [Nocardioides sp. B-3]
MHQSIDLAVAAEELGADGAYYRVHHFARQLASPFPLLAAIGARTSRIEIGTGVIDMRYENPLYMAEDAGAADLIADGRLQLGISRGSPEQVIEGYRYFGFEPKDGDHATMAREHTAVFLRMLEGEGFAEPNPRPMFPNPPGLLRLEPHSEGLRERIWWGAATRATAEWTAEQGMNLMSSTLLTEDTGVPFHQLRAEQIQRFRDAWKAAGHEREPRVSVSRSIMPLVSEIDHAYFGNERRSTDPVGMLEGGKARFGKTYAAEPDVPGQAARRGRGRGGCRHVAADGAQPAGRRLQRGADRERAHARGPGARLALTRQSARSPAVMTTATTTASTGDIRRHSITAATATPTV